MDRDKYTFSLAVALIEVYLRVNEQQTLKYEYFQPSMILDAEYIPATLDDVIRTCENKSLHSFIYVENIKHFQ
jgi:hypothetical protein